MKKKIMWGLAAVAAVMLCTAAVIASGILVTPTVSSLAKDRPVPARDILAIQQQQEESVLADYDLGAYDIQTPYLIQDPYSANPLSALLIFETRAPARITLTTPGKDSYTTFTYTSAAEELHHEVAVLGLYPGQTNQITLTALYADGHSESSQQKIITEPLPFNFPQIQVQKANPGQMEPGIDLMTACLDTNYTYLLDANGDIRGYFSNKNFGHCSSMRVLKNGHLLVTGDVLKLMPYNMYDIWEINLLGKIFVEYNIPNAVHHDINVLQNGDILATSNNLGMPQNYNTREDVIIRIDQNTGLVTQQFDLRQIMDERRSPYQHYDPGVVNAPNRDWAHLNSVKLDEATNTLIASSPIQSAVVKLDVSTQKIVWILGPHDGWDGEFSKYQPYLLQPVGEPFEWQWGQHDINILPDDDGNPDTTDLLLFDNGQARSFTQQGSVQPENNYSRAVIYRVHEGAKTVEQIWTYGKERGSEAYATFLGGAEQTAQKGNINIMFGGMLRQNGVPVDNIVSGVIGQQEIHSRVVEVQKDGTVVFDALVTPKNGSDAATYQVHKIDLYNQGTAVQLGQSQGQRKGETQSIAPTSYSLPGFFIPTLAVDFKQIYQKNGQLIAQGSFQYQGKNYMLGKIFLVLKNSQSQYVYSSNPGINGSFSAQIDLSKLPPGEYAIYAAGGVVDGMDARGKMQAGYVSTGYKVQVP